MGCSHPSVSRLLEHFLNHLICLHLLHQTKPQPTSRSTGLSLVRQSSLSRSQSSLVLHLNLSQVYGPIFSLRLGSKYGIVVTSPSMGRQVLKDHDVIFANRDVPVAARVITSDGCDVVFSSYGSKWRMLRKVLVQWRSSNTTMDFVYKLRREEVRKTVGHLYNRVGSPVDVGKEMFLTVLNTSARTILGQMEQGDEGTVMGSEFREVMTLIMKLIGKPNLSDFFPGLAWFDLQGVGKQMLMVVQQFDHIFEKIIKQRLKKKKKQLVNGSEAEESKDFFEFLLKTRDEADSKMPLNMANIKALLVDMVIGGTDTSSNTIEFAMAHLLMKRVREELDSIVGKNNMVEESHIQKLPYLLAVMEEALRLHPVVPLLVPHCPSETTSVGGYAIPKGSRVFVNGQYIETRPLGTIPYTLILQGSWMLNVITKGVILVIYRLALDEEHVQEDLWQKGPFCIVLQH